MMMMMMKCPEEYQVAQQMLNNVQPLVFYRSTPASNGVTRIILFRIYCSAHSLLACLAGSLMPPVGIAARVLIDDTILLWFLALLEQAHFC